jgi:hypothetical protein
MSLGGWEVKVCDGLPQKVATGLARFDEQILGAEYVPISYLGSQVVNGINHAVLAEQTLLTGRDTKNAVVMVFNEPPKAMDVSLVSINTLVAGGHGMGAVEINMTTDIPVDAKAAFVKAFEGFVGSKVEPFAYIGQQVTKGVNYIFACTVTPVTLETQPQTLSLVTVNSLDNKADMKPFFSDTQNNGLGYAFTW